MLKLWIITTLIVTGIPQGPTDIFNPDEQFNTLQTQVEFTDQENEKLPTLNERIRMYQSYLKQHPSAQIRSRIEQRIIELYQYDGSPECITAALKFATQLLASNEFKTSEQHRTLFTIAELIIHAPKHPDASYDILRDHLSKLINSLQAHDRTVTWLRACHYMAESYVFEGDFRIAAESYIQILKKVRADTSGTTLLQDMWDRDSESCANYVNEKESVIRSLIFAIEHSGGMKIYHRVMSEREFVDYYIILKQIKPCKGQDGKIWPCLIDKSEGKSISLTVRY